MSEQQRAGLSPAIWTAIATIIATLITCTGAVVVAILNNYRPFFPITPTTSITVSYTPNTPPPTVDNVLSATILPPSTTSTNTLLPPSATLTPTDTPTSTPIPSTLTYTPTPDNELCSPTYALGGTSIGTGEILLFSGSSSAQGAKVYLNGICQEKMLTRDNEAVLLIAQVPPGIYRIRVSKPGYLVFERDVSVKSGERIEVNFDLFSQ